MPSPQAGGPGFQYVFTGWSDGGSASHSVEVTALANTYTANFKLQYQLTTAVSPASAGTVNVASGAFFDAGSNVAVVATPKGPFVFDSWSGASSSKSNPAFLTLDAPRSITAHFILNCAVTGDTMASVTDVQLMVKEALGTAMAPDDFNQDGVVNIADVQKVINAALHLGCF